MVRLLLLDESVSLLCPIPARSFVLTVHLSRTDMTERTIRILALFAIRACIGAQHHSTCLRGHRTRMRIRTSLVGATHAKLANFDGRWLFRHGFVNQ